MRLYTRPIAVVFLLTIGLLSGCASDSHPKAATSTGASTNTKIGVQVEAAFGSKPTLTIPDTAAPATLTQEVLTPGTGTTVAKGDTLIVNYLGQTWAPKSGKPNVFDSSFDRGQPAAFVIGVGRVIPGWDETLVGQKIGTRVLVSIPPAEGYGSDGQPSANIDGTDTLVFVIDVVADYKPDASAPGTAVAKLPATDFPKITNVAGKPPTILSSKGVPVPAKPVATLLVTGSGAKIDATKSLVLQIVQSDLDTNKNLQSSWGESPQVAQAQDVLSVAPVLTDQNIGSRVLILVPATAAIAATETAAAQPASPPQVLIADVIGQF